MLEQTSQPALQDACSSDSVPTSPRAAQASTANIASAEDQPEAEALPEDIVTPDGPHVDADTELAASAAALVASVTTAAAAVPASSVPASPLAFSPPQDSSAAPATTQTYATLQQQASDGMHSKPLGEAVHPSAQQAIPDITAADPLQASRILPPAADAAVLSDSSAALVGTARARLPDDGMVGMQLRASARASSDSQSIKGTCTPARASAAAEAPVQQLRTGLKELRAGVPPSAQSASKWLSSQVSQAAHTVLAATCLLPAMS